MAIVAIPDAIASATLAGVNPPHGFNALMVGTRHGSIASLDQGGTSSGRYPSLAWPQPDQEYIYPCPGALRSKASGYER